MIPGESYIVGICTGLAAFFACRLIERMWRRGNKPRDTREYVDRLEEPGVRLLMAHYHLAQCREDMADVIAQAPEQFEPAILDGEVLGRQIMAAVHRHAESRGGFYRPGVDAPPAKKTWRKWIAERLSGEKALLDADVSRPFLVPAERPTVAMIKVGPSGPVQDATVDAAPIRPAQATKTPAKSGIRWLNVNGQMVPTAAKEI